MKKLKLEVGKTYRSREGKEVRIISKDREGKYLYKGSNDEWYTESGRWQDFSEEDPEDLIEEIEELPETRHTFTIPDGVKEITLDYFGNRIVVEMVPEEVEGPKPGDVMRNEQGSVYILKEVTPYNSHRHFAWLGEDGRLSIGRMCLPGRPATPKEAQLLFDALKKAGKRWNAETMQVEEVPERERIMDFLQGCAIDTTWIRWLTEGYLKYMEGEK